IHQLDGRTRNGISHDGSYNPLDACRLCRKSLRKDCENKKNSNHAEEPIDCRQRFPWPKRYLGDSVPRNAVNIISSGKQWTREAMGLSAFYLTVWALSFSLSHTSSIRSVSGISRSPIFKVQGLVYDLGSSMVTRTSISPILVR